MGKRDTFSILIADDHEIVRSGIKFSIESEERFYIEDEASSYEELQRLLSTREYALLILDLNLGDKNGIQTIKDISQQYEDLPILVLSMFPEDPYALQSIQAGARGYLNKKSVSTELRYAIHKIMDGKIYINEAYKEMLPFGTTLDKSSKNSIAALSHREFEVYTLLVSGMSSKEIAEQLELSQKTISTYRTRILDKLSLSNTTQLIHFALQDTLGYR